MVALNTLALQPHPRFRKRIVGYTEDRTRLHFYLGVSGDKHERTEIRLPNDRSFLVSILIDGPSGSGKSITTRILIENFFLEWKIFGDRWRHPIIIFDSKTNYLGLDKPNRKPRDRYLLEAIHTKWNKFLAIPKDLIHVYMPAYCAPTDKRTVLKTMRQKWGAEGFWGVPWRHITDLAHLGTVLKVPETTLWAEDLRPTFEKCSIDPAMTLKGLIGVGGELHKAAKRIRNTASRNAALSFVERWRKNRFWFSETDKLAEHLEDPFSINVLTFVETPEKIYFNQLALLIALESLMATLQESKAETQPVIVIHDVLNFLGEDKPFRNQIVDALRRLLAGQARTLSHGYVVILETQSLDLPKELGDYKKYTVHLRLKWKSQSEALKRVPGFIGGICLPEGYDVLTPHGTKDIRDVAVNDCVYSEGEFSPAIAKTSRFYSGNLVKLTCFGVNLPLALTPEHPVQIIRPRKCGSRNFCRPYRQCSRCGYPIKDSWSPQWVFASDIQKGDFLLFPTFQYTNPKSALFLSDFLDKIGKDGNILRRVCYNQFGALTHRGSPILDCIDGKSLGDFLELCGYYLAEGSSDTQGSSVLSFGFHEHKLASRVESLLNSLFPNVNSKSSMSHEKSMLRVRIYSKMLHDVFCRLFGNNAHEKKIHPLILGMPEPYICRLLYSFFRGDGCQVQRSNGAIDYIFTTTSKTLAWQTFMLLTKIGISPIIAQNFVKSFGIKRECYIVRVSREYNRLFEEKLGLPSQSTRAFSRSHRYNLLRPPYLWMLIRSKEFVPYSGIVYNIKMATGTYVVNGVNIHNCDLHDHFNNFHRPSVVVRPPLTSYSV